MKVLIAYIFSVFILVSSIAPSVILVSKIDIDISLVMDCGEEEKEGKEPFKDAEFKIVQEFHNHSLFLEEKEYSNIEYYFNDYVSKSQDLTSPPPEYI